MFAAYPVDGSRLVLTVGGGCQALCPVQDADRLQSLHPAGDLLVSTTEEGTRSSLFGCETVDKRGCCNAQWLSTTTCLTGLKGVLQSHYLEFCVGPRHCTLRQRKKRKYQKVVRPLNVLKITAACMINMIQSRSFFSSLLNVNKDLHATKFYIRYRGVIT